MLSKAYLDTARTLLRAAETMTDRSVACQLKALAEGYERQAAKVAHADAAKAQDRAVAQTEHELQGGVWGAIDDRLSR
jgi:hypothetical protein